MEQKISVIVPAYNVEKYIRRCLDSLVNQTYSQMEIIVVDDGSTDGTGEIIQEYVERYEGKVFLFSQENAGQAVARNNGIQYATGDYIGFVDADDFVHPRMYEKLQKEAEEKDCDLVTCGYYGCDDMTGEIQVYQAGCRGSFDQSVYENPDILRLNAPYPWNKLYRKELLKETGFAFPEGIIFEDLAAIFPLFLEAKKVGRVHEKLYYYIKGRKGGTMSTFNRKHMQILDALQIVDEKFKDKGAFETFRDILLFFHLRHIQARFDEMQEFQDTSFEEEFRQRADELMNRYFPGWKESECYRHFKQDKVEEGKAEESKETLEEIELEEKSISQKPKEKKVRKAQLFEDYLETRPLEKGLVLIESYHGNDCIETGYYFARALSKEKKYQVCVVAAEEAKKEKFQQLLGGEVEVLLSSSLEYVEKLATAEIVMNNQAFPGYYRKRKGQKFIFMDFLPFYRGEGRNATYQAKNMQGIQFSLAQADWILFPEEGKGWFRQCLDTYCMGEICEKKGLFVSLKKLGFPEKKKEKKEPFVVAYSPSPKVFPELKDSKNFLFLSELKRQLLYLDEHLQENEVVMVHYPRTIRRRLVDKGWKHIRFFPEQTETYQVLAGCDAMVGEAERELFVMKAWGKPVCRWNYNDCERQWTQGPMGEFLENSMEERDSLDGILQWIHEKAREKKERSETEVVWEDWLEQVSAFIDNVSSKKGGHCRRKMVYVPAIRNFSDFQKMLPEIREKGEQSIFVFEKDSMCEGVTSWMRKYCPQIQFLVVIRSLVIGKKESRMIKWKITTKDKLRIKRDKERYLGG